MSLFKTCPHCGAHLDPGEGCDCLPALRAEAKRLLARLTEDEVAEVMTAVMKKAAQGATNTMDG